MKNPIVLHVHVEANAKHHSISENEAGIMRIKVKAPAMRGQANEAARALIAGFFGKKNSQVVLVSGATNPKKIFHVF